MLKLENYAASHVGRSTDINTPACMHGMWMARRGGAWGWLGFGRGWLPVGPRSAVRVGMQSGASVSSGRPEELKHFRCCGSSPDLAFERLHGIVL